MNDSYYTTVSWPKELMGEKPSPNLVLKAREKKEKFPVQGR